MPCSAKFLVTLHTEILSTGTSDFLKQMIFLKSTTFSYYTRRKISCFNMRKMLKPRTHKGITSLHLYALRSYDVHFTIPLFRVFFSSSSYFLFLSKLSNQREVSVFYVIFCVKYLPLVCISDFRNKKYKNS